MHVVVGLGNPGPRYADTRHNIGFRVVDRLAPPNPRWVAVEQAATIEARVAGRDVLLVKPQTYMNLSGQAVRSLQERLGFERDQVLVVVDDFLLDFGRLRLRRGGSDGGHNGLASVLQELQTDRVPRLRLGIGPLPPGQAEIDYVLAPFAAAEDVDGLSRRGCDAVACWLAEGIDVAMNRFNGISWLTAGQHDNE